MRFVSIASGSSGNISFIGSDETCILVDAGVNMKTIQAGLSELDLSLKDIDAVFITHEHIDHVRGIGAILRKYHIPAYATLETFKAMLKNSALGELPKDCLHPVLPDQTIGLKDFSVIPFSIDHDAAGPVAYRIEAETEGKSVAVATDMGRYTPYTIQHLKNLDVLMIEANHDIGMLMNGSYPMFLKRRIFSDYGHLSNVLSGQLIDAVLNDNIRKIFLAHLSEENNFPELALRTVCQEIDRSENPYKSSDFSISVAKRYSISEIVEF